MKSSTVETPTQDLTAWVIGATRAQRIPALVTEYTIRRQQPRPCVIYHTWPLVQPEPKTEKNRARTGFSFVRHYAPDIIREDRAVYLDSDMLVLAPWGDLADFDLRGACVAVPPHQCAVVVYDLPKCRKAWTLEGLFDALDNGRAAYADVMTFRFLAEGDQIVRDLPPVWNSCDRKDEHTKLLHYTNMRRQPWLAEGHPLQDFWVKTLIAAVNAGILTWEDVEEDIVKGHIRATLMRDVRRVEGLVAAAGGA